jgi:enamine deaminase RidA (YjgF/YER057c/UK114 family)
VDRRHRRRNISGHSPYEQTVGFSRVVVVGRDVRVSGTAPIPRDGEPPDDAYGQAKLCLEIIGEALSAAGASFDDVVRTRLFLVDADDFEEVARAHGEVFSAIRPASTALVVKALLDPRWRVEMDADAVLP